MKRINNKGFAISTLIYGLAIMGIMIVAILMATMAQTRTNTTGLVKSIEEDLNRFSRTETAFKPIGSTIIAQEYIVPASGWYKIELWGAQGSGNGGKGAYTSGIIELIEGDVLYFYVGEKRSTGGGPATEVRAINGPYDESTSYETSIMVAAGGGTSSTASGGTLRGYSDKMISYGGFIKSQGTDKDFSLIALGLAGNNTNGSLVGYNQNYELSTAATPQVGVNVPSPIGSNGGGDGYFPSNNASTGGASFIAGYAGCYGIVKGDTTQNAKVEYYEHTYYEEDTVATYTYNDTKLGEYYFVDGVMLPGVRTGDGYAKIERVKAKTEASTALARKNSKLNGIRYIKNCTDDATWDKIIVSVKGNTIVKTPSSPINGCVTIDLEENVNADEISIFHTNTGVDYKNDELSVSDDGVNWKTLKNKVVGVTLSETETITGYRISAYQYDVTKTLPNTGNYIIQPVLSENKVLTAASSAETNANPITIEPYNGELRQKWSIELITDKKISPGYIENDPSTYEYKIVELARFKALSITQDENLVFNTLSAIDKFNEKSRNEPQIWKITPVGNGTYTISTVVPSPNIDTGNIVAQTNNSVSDAFNQIIISKNNTETERFKLMQIDYSSN